MSAAGFRVEDVEKLEKSPLIAKDIPIYGVIYHTEASTPLRLYDATFLRCTCQSIFQLECTGTSNTAWF